MTTAQLRKSEFQTPPELAKFMVDLIPKGAITILEPTPGDGNIVNAFGPFVDITAPADFFAMEKQRFDCVVMNPPFSIEYTYGAPYELNKKGSQVGYHILKGCPPVVYSNQLRKANEGNKSVGIKVGMYCSAGVVSGIPIK